MGDPGAHQPRSDVPDVRSDRRPARRDRDAPMVVNSLAARLRIAPSEAKRRMRVAARIQPRRQLTGPALAPELPLVAAALEAGTIGEDHLRVICRALDTLPSCVSPMDRDDVQASLLRQASKSDAEIVKAVARRIEEIFNPDGDYDEADRARRRGVTLGQQGRDGMSRLSGFIDPETRCYVEAVSAAVRPGRHLPDGTTLVETPEDRSGAQRRHDGIKLALTAGHRLRRAGRPPRASGHRDRAHHAGRTQPGRPRRHQPLPAPARTGGDT